MSVMSLMLAHWSSLQLGSFLLTSSLCAGFSEAHLMNSSVLISGVLFLGSTFGLFYNFHGGVPTFPPYPPFLPERKKEGVWGREGEGGRWREGEERRKAKLTFEA